MKRQFSFLSLFQPIYILFAGAIGFIATKIMFVQWVSPFLVKEPGDRFFRVPYPNFLALVLVVAVFLAFLTIIFFASMETVI
jgi:hypothetical protein